MDASDWLLPQPTTMTPTTGVLNADGSLNGPTFAEFASMLADELAVSLPAFAEDGSPVIPPDRHILDHLSGAWDLVDGNARRVDRRGRATTVRAETGPLPECAFCNEPAGYDGHVDTPKGRRPARMCVQEDSSLTGSCNEDPVEFGLPKLPKPVARALAEGGYTRLAQYGNVWEHGLSTLHGVGPLATGQLREALADAGVSFCGRVSRC